MTLTKRGGKRRRMKIGIRPQLIILVGFSSLFSLLILAIVVGVYFTKNLSSLRADRLEVISQLKSTQLSQSIQYIYYQIYYLSQRDAITSPLAVYKAGNISLLVFADAQLSLDQLLTSSDTFASAKLYNLDLTVVALSENSAVRVASSTEDALYPLAKDSEVPRALTLSSLSYVLPEGMMSGPLPNSTNSNSSYFFGLTVPIYSNTSIILDQPSVSGYLSVISGAQTIRSALTSKSGDYSVATVKGIYANSSVIGNSDALIGYESLFPVEGSLLQPNVFFPISSSDAVEEALTHESGFYQHLRLMTGHQSAVGFKKVRVDESNVWTIMIEQRQSRFLAPVHRLTRIMIGVVIGIGAFMCFITFPLAVWFVNPITKLKEATEAITKSKKEKDNQAAYGALARSHSTRSNLSESQAALGKTNTGHTISSGSSTVYSSGIRLPARIPQSKKLFKDELTELSEAFNIMTQELETQYSHLEERVKLRTKELEASKIEAEAANEAKTVFIANISHELRTPLNGILGMTSIALEETDHLQVQDSLKLIHRSGELLLHILTELLTYSKNTLNRSKLEKSNFQILEIVHQVRSIFGKLAVDQRVNFKVLVKPNSLRKLILFGDSNRIIQVVMNLVSNSLKFTPVDGNVDVTFRLIGEYDEKKSLEHGYQRVCIKNPPHGDSHSNETARGLIVTSPRPPPRPPLRTPSKGNYPGTNENPKDDLVSIISGMSEQEEKINEKSDTQSLVTLATAEYEKALFNSQFSYNKPLPTPPLENYPENVHPSPATSVKSGTDNKVISTRPRAHTHRSHLSESSNIFAEQAHFAKKLDLFTSPHLLSNSEMVKNNKVYKMRKLYQPKVWAIQIEVKDTGSGIEPALQEKVFEPFIQGDQTLSRSYGGTGLGLSICRQLAKMMHGTLTLKSSLGKGSTFKFTVPLPQNGEILVPEECMEEFCNDEFNPDSKVNRKVVFDIDNHSEPEDEKETPDTPNGSAEQTKSENSTPTTQDQKSPKKFNGHLDLPKNSLRIHHLQDSSTGTVDQSHAGDTLLGSLSHLKILVAEDNSVNQEVIKRMLRLEGFTNVTMAGNGAEAVDYVQNAYETDSQFDMIFMDVQMPKMDGLTATKLIRNNLKYGKPIIALTAFADESNVKECLNSGMSGFLSKPIKRTNLRQIITEFSTEIFCNIVTTPVGTDEHERRSDFPVMLPHKIKP